MIPNNINRDYPQATIHKVLGEYALISHTSMSYFSPSGKASLATKKSYEIIRYDSVDTDEWCYWMRAKNKSEGLKLLKECNS